MTPTELRAARREGSAAAGAGLTVRLPARVPFDGDALISFLAARAVPGIEEAVDGAYRRSLRLPARLRRGRAGRGRGPRRGPRCWLEDLRDFGPAVSRCRRLLDLDSDPVAVSERLGSEPVVGGLVRAAPGRRVAGERRRLRDGREGAARPAGIGPRGARAGGAARGGPRRAAARAGRWRHARVPLGGGARRASTRRRWRCRSRAGGRSSGLARAIDDGELVLDGGADRDEVGRTLLALPGIGQWTAGYVAMRELRDPDAFLPGDAGVRRSLVSLGRDGSPREAAELAERWRPYRAYALQHLWSHERLPRGRSTAPAVARRDGARRPASRLGEAPAAEDLRQRALARGLQPRFRVELDHEQAPVVLGDHVDLEVLAALVAVEEGLFAGRAPASEVGVGCWPTWTPSARAGWPTRKGSSATGL